MIIPHNGNIGMCLVGGKRAAGPCPSLPEDTEHCQHVAEREASKGGVDPKKQMKTGENLGQRMLFPRSLEHIPVASFLC